MDISEKILQLLKNLDESLACTLCNEKCKNPIRIIMCGHYFCEKCIKNYTGRSRCPQCKGFFGPQDVKTENVARQTEEPLKDLRELLQNIQKSNVKPKKSDQNIANAKNLPEKTTHVSKHDNNIFEHNGKQYHVNYTDIFSIKKNSKGETKLHLACKKFKLNEIQNLLKQKIDINAKDYAGWTPLHEAIQSGNVEVVEFLLKNGCLINIPGSDYATPLHKAASLDKIDLVKLLLKYGADRDMVEYSGLKPANCTTKDEVKEVLESYNDSPINVLYEVYLPSNIHVYAHSIDEEYKNKLVGSKKITLVNKMDPIKKITHIAIKKTHKVSFKILQAMLEGLQFITQESIDDFIDGNYFLDIPNYVFLTGNDDLNRGIRKSMISTCLRHPKLFEGVNFFIEDHLTPVQVYHLKVDKEYLTKLIKAGDGHVLHRAPALRTCESDQVHPFFASKSSKAYWCCNFIIYAENNVPDLKYNMPELQHRTSKWLIDCIINHDICD
ncbi:BRCA1-associated RING domain protein 1-like [Sitophilus oryzae]|uniref:BRCA1-associated RING domain protein 1-like n=1 Tax=Sitophilus oryzae TaxID=7048 RepID=A0A6J2Y8M7_SITOR|nr:BRCA1-associated RING domain protein 1-like [Sitophilus oryzae]